MICLPIIAVYSNTIHSPFIFDDFNAIVDNPNIRSLLPLSRSLSAPDQSTVAGRPVAAFSLAVNYAVSRLDPWSYHFLNMLLHCAAAWLFFGIMREISGRGRGIGKGKEEKTDGGLDETALGRDGDKARGRSPMVEGRGGVSPPGVSPPFMRCDDPRWSDAGAKNLTLHPVSLLLITLMWALHPLHTEAITYVSTRTELLMGVFSLATVQCLIRSADSARPVFWWICGVAASTLAMASKESAVVLPILLLLFDRVFIARSWGAVVSLRGKFHLATAATWLILIALVMQGSRSETAGIHLTGISPLDYLRTQAGVILHYLRLAVWPHPLVLDYFDWPVARVWTPVNATILFVLLCLAVVSFVKAARGSVIGFLGVWFFLTLAPASSVLPIVSEIAAERRMYLPMIAVVLLGARGIHSLSSHVAPTRFRKSERLVAVIICILLGVMTWQRNQVFASALGIWRDTVTKRPGNSRAHANLGTEYLRLGRHAEAADHFRAAIEKDPAAQALFTGNESPGIDPVQIDISTLRALENLGLIQTERGDTAEAVHLLQLVVDLNPNDAVTHLNLGNAYMLNREPMNAETAFAQAVRLAPDHALARIRYARVLALQGRLEEAKTQARQALHLDPENSEIQSFGIAILQASDQTDTPRH